MILQEDYPLHNLQFLGKGVSIQNMLYFVCNNKVTLLFSEDELRKTTKMDEYGALF